MTIDLKPSFLMSSVWDQPDGVRITWITLLMLADSNGVVHGCSSGIARRANLSHEETLTALDWLSSPDPDSERKRDEGVRINRIEGGWQILCADDFCAVREDTERAPYTGRGYVYFIQSGDCIKIGFSRNPAGRMESLKPALSKEPSLLGSFPGTISDERQLHEKFEHLRQHGEWFQASEELLEFIHGRTQPE